MPHPQLEREELKQHSLDERENRVDIERQAVPADALPKALSERAADRVAATAEAVRRARKDGKPVVLAFGAHTIKNGLGLVLQKLIEDEWVTHLATNGAGIIHDWEFSFQGKSSEDVAANIDRGCFGIWAETGFNINLAIVLGALDNLGYGESVGRLIEDEKHVVPDVETLRGMIERADDSVAAAERAAAAADVLATVRRFGLTPGETAVPHPWKTYSIQAAAYRLGIPFTAHPMFGHDIIYTHPLNHGAAIGRTAQRDFLTFAHQIADIDGGVYLSVGSAVMSPMIFEKSLSMAQNLALQHGSHIDNHSIVVVDLAETHWDWSQGEPPPESPEYYLRYCKTFSRMGGTMDYVTADNRDFLLGLLRALE